MEYDFSTLNILGEVTTAFVAFAVIVASIRLTIGGELTPFQKLLVHYFTESGLLAVSICLFPGVLWRVWPDESIVAAWTTWFTLITSVTYTAFYLRRRMRLKVRMPLLSAFVFLGWFIWFAVLGITLTGIFWQPSLAMITLICYWALCSSGLIFVSFLSSFIGFQSPLDEPQASPVRAP